MSLREKEYIPKEERKAIIESQGLKGKEGHKILKWARTQEVP